MDAIQYTQVINKSTFDPKQPNQLDITHPNHV